MAKTIARDFDVSEQTANRWLQKHAPTTAHLEAMADRWGKPFIEALFPEALAEGDPRAEALLRLMAGESSSRDVEAQTARVLHEIGKLGTLLERAGVPASYAFLEEAGRALAGLASAPGERLVFLKAEAPPAALPSTARRLLAELARELESGAPSPTLPRSAGEGEEDGAANPPTPSPAKQGRVGEGERKRKRKREGKG